MKLFSTFAIASLSVSVAVASSSLLTAQAAVINTDFSLTNFTGDTAEVSVTLTEITGVGVQFDVSIVKPPTINGDLFGFYASVKNDNVGAITDIDGDDITATKIDTNNVINLGGGNNLSGYQGTYFDFGITFGRSGSSTGLLEKTSFTVAGLTLNDFYDQTFGARLQSTGDNLNGSSKLVGDLTGETQVPEPLTMLGTLAAIGVGAGLKRKSRQNQDSADA